MKCLLLSHPDSETDHHLIHQGVWRGVFAFHIRKPAWTLAQLENYISGLPEVVRRKSVLHTHYYPLSVKGAEGLPLHIVTRHRDDLINKSVYARSSPCHSLEEVESFHPYFEYVFLSPVFSSISKENYVPSVALSQDRIRTYLQNHTQVRCVALGGIDQSKISLCNDMGFYGVALMGAVWGAASPSDSLSRCVDICRSFSNK